MNVENLIKDSLQKTQKISWEKGTPNDEQKKRKLIFPSYRVEKNEKVDEEKHKRISEQEARFLFVRELEKPENADFYYSVETPTIFKYRFSENREGKVKKITPDIVKEKGESGKTDVCIYDTNFNRKYLVEFKALNKDSLDFEKDFIKLKFEPKESCEPNYFVHILKSYNKGTIEGTRKNPQNSLIEKYKAAFESSVDENTKKINKITKENEVIVFLCVLKVRKKYKPKTQIIRFNKDDYPKKLNELLNEI